MQRTVERALVAKVGTFVFVAVLGLPMTLPPSRAQASVIVASAVDDRSAASASASLEVPQLVEGTIAHELPEVRPPAVLREVATAASAIVEVPAAPAPPAAPPVALPPPPPPPPPPPLVLDGTVTASWYGPGFYGNRTACGQTYTPEILGVAHRTLPCGTRIRITSPAGVTVTVPVIDRGPYIAGRTLDLSNATRIALRCSDLCTVRMTVIQ